LPSSTLPRNTTGKGADDGVPSTDLGADEISEGIPLFKLFQLTGLSSSGGAARRLIRQGGAYVNNERVTADDRPVTLADFVGGELLLRSGKKHFHRVRLTK
jgi:tyrosyl-tRNA synthetase